MLNQKRRGNCRGDRRDIESKILESCRGLTSVPGLRYYLLDRVKRPSSCGVGNQSVLVISRGLVLVTVTDNGAK